MRVRVGLSTVWILAACASGPVDGLTPTPGASARIVLAVSGGLAGLADTTVIDSVSSLLVRTSCLSIRGAAESCAAGRREWRVSLSAGARDSVFRATQTAEFRTLRAQYDMSGTFVDGPAYDLEITIAATTRRIRWSDAPGLPVALTAFVTSIQARTADR